MKTNILKAITNLVNNPVYKLNEFYKSNNRANNMGDALEEYIKDIFANTINEKDINIRNEKISQTFSYLGNKNNPPDIIIRGGDAIEVKKIESSNSALALNSSYPKSKLYANSIMITKTCRECENWNEKDIIYTVGVVKDNCLNSVCMVYGIDYAADLEIYEEIKRVIKDEILTINDVEFAETNELGRVNRVDPLGITYLRVRGMWHIENPMKTFNYIYKSSQSDKFSFMALINNEKYFGFSVADRIEFEKMVKENSDISMSEVNIKNPNNPAILKNAYLITYNN
ncbi:MAG: NgoPII family restriction endonuclease [Clostridia bacterium]